MRCQWGFISEQRVWQDLGGMQFSSLLRRDTRGRSWIQGLLLMCRLKAYTEERTFGCAESPLCRLQATKGVSDYTDVKLLLSWIFPAGTLLIQVPSASYYWYKKVYYRLCWLICLIVQYMYVLYICWCSPWWDSLPWKGMGHNWRIFFLCGCSWMLYFFIQAISMFLSK